MQNAPTTLDKIKALEKVPKNSYKRPKRKLFKQVSNKIDKETKKWTA